MRNAEYLGHFNQIYFKSKIRHYYQTHVTKLRTPLFQCGVEFIISRPNSPLQNLQIPPFFLSLPLHYEFPVGWNGNRDEHHGAKTMRGPMSEKSSRGVPRFHFHRNKECFTCIMNPFGDTNRVAHHGGSACGPNEPKMCKPAFVGRHWASRCTKYKL